MAASGRRCCKYFPTVRGETRIPSFSCNSLAMRSSPQVGFSAAISRIRSRRFLGKRGLPVGFDFQRQKSRNPLRCQRMSVSGLTFTSASAPLEHSAQSRHQPASGIVGPSGFDLALLEERQLLAEKEILRGQGRCGNGPRGKPAGPGPTTTKDNVRKQCATARKIDEPDMNAQDRTLQNVTGFQVCADFLRSTVVERFPLDVSVGERWRSLGVGASLATR